MDAERFAKLITDALERLPAQDVDRVRVLVDALLLFDDFPSFVKMMVAHNARLQGASVGR